MKKNNTSKVVINSIMLIGLATLVNYPAYSNSETVTNTSVTSTSNNTQAEVQNNGSNPPTKTTTTTITSTITKPNQDDEKLVSAIYAKYAKESALIGTNLTVKCKNGYATVTGTVTAQSQEDQAIIAAKSIPGVKDVVSEINVLTNPDNKTSPKATNY